MRISKKKHLKYKLSINLHFVKTTDHTYYVRNNFYTNEFRRKSFIILQNFTLLGIGLMTSLTVWLDFDTSNLPSLILYIKLSHYVLFLFNDTIIYTILCTELQNVKNFCALSKIMEKLVVFLEMNGTLTRKLFLYLAIVTLVCILM